MSGMKRRSGGGDKRGREEKKEKVQDSVAESERRAASNTEKVTTNWGQALLCEWTRKEQKENVEVDVAMVCVLEGR
jgi:hypothetical protein